MPQQTDFAKRIRLCRVSTQWLGRKLRVAGKLFDYDAESGLALILDGSYGLLVDITLVMDAKSSKWAEERLSPIIAIGHLEESDDTLQAQFGSAHSVVFQHLVFRAILVVPAPYLDLGLWNTALMEEEEEEEREL